MCLRGGDGPHEGNVYIGVGNGISKPVCDDLWDIRDGMVVCRELGYLDIVEVNIENYVPPTDSLRLFIFPEGDRGEQVW